MGTNERAEDEGGAGSAGSGRAIAVAGATGFIGSRLAPELARRGFRVVAASRRPPPAGALEGVAWRACDVAEPASVENALGGARVAYYLVHSLGQGRSDYAERDRRAAETFARAAARAGVERVIYLGGPVRLGALSNHLQSRAEVGRILRAGPVPALELRASMVVGAGSASWRIVRDLAKRLPAMVAPSWLRSRTRPVAIDDAVAALAAAAEVPLEESAVYDIPGPDVLSGREILERIAALEGRKLPAIAVPVLTPRLSAMWLRLVTSEDYDLARELVLGLSADLLPEDDAYWELIGHTDLVSFDEAARRALAEDPPPRGLRGRLAHWEERAVARALAARPPEGGPRPS